MALVPFRTLGPSADQSAQERLFQVGALAITIRQYPRVGLRTIDNASQNALIRAEIDAAETAAAPAAAAAAQVSGTVGQQPASKLVPGDDSSSSSSATTKAGPSASHPLGSVGLVAWQCGFLLADYLLRCPPFGSWHAVHAVDLGCGTGLVGISLALSGATVTLTDLPHILGLTSQNVRINCERHCVAVWPEVKEHVWGDAATAAALLPQPDLITAADVLYDPQHFGALIFSLELLCAPHTLVYIAWKKRHVEEEAFQALAEGRGFVVEQVPAEDLAEEYRDGTYVVLRLSRLEPMDVEQ